MQSAAACDAIVEQTRSPPIWSLNMKANFQRLHDWCKLLHIFIYHSSEEDVERVRTRICSSLQNAELRHLLQLYGEDLGNLVHWIRDGLLWMSERKFTVCVSGKISHFKVGQTTGFIIPDEVFTSLQNNLRGPATHGDKAASKTNSISPFEPICAFCQHWQAKIPDEDILVDSSEDEESQSSSEVSDSPDQS